MDYSNLTPVELSAVSTTLGNVRMALRSDVANLPAGFPDMLAEFLAMDGDGQDALLDDMSALASFKAYAVTLGNADIAPALMQVARDMAGMSARELKTVASGGLTKLSAMK